MGASESTAKPLNSNEEEEEEEQRRRLQQNVSDVVKAGAVIAAGAATAWAICRKPRNSTEEEEEQRRRLQRNVKAGAVIAAGAATAWGIGRMLSGETEKEENREAMMHGQRVVLPSYDDTYEQQHLNMNAPDQSETRWSPPPPGHLKMNTDAGCRPSHRRDGSVEQGPSGCGGILRDHLGNCVGGFREFIDTNDCLTAEIKGILGGLHFLDRHGYEESILESDCDAAVQWITKLVYSGNPKGHIIPPCWGDIVKCEELIKKNKITVRSCGREANKCADKLADTAIERQLPYQEFEDVPDEIRSIVERDSPGVRSFLI